MATNERENARKERARQKDKKTKRIIWIVLGVIILILAIMRISEIDFKSIKNRYTDQDGKFKISMTTDDKAYPYQLDSSTGVRVFAINNKITAVTDNSLTILNPSNAKPLYSFDHGYANPMVTHAGSYICIADQGGTRLRVDTTNENLYEQTFDNKVLTADIANNGTVIYATKSNKAKSTIFVVNKSLKSLAKMDINDGYVTSVAIDSSGKKCAYTTVNSADAVFTSVVHTFDVGKNKDIATFKYKNSNVLDLHYCSSTLYIVGGDMLSVVTSQKKEKPVLKQGSVYVNNFTYTPSDELIIDYSDYADSTESTLSYVKTNAKQKTAVKIKDKVKNMSATSKEVTVLYNNKVVSYSVTSGKQRSSIPCEDSLRSANAFSSKTFVVRGRMLDVLE